MSIFFSLFLILVELRGRAKSVQVNIKKHDMRDKTTGQPLSRDIRNSQHQLKKSIFTLKIKKEEEDQKTIINMAKAEETIKHDMDTAHCNDATVKTEIQQEDMAKSALHLDPGNCFHKRYRVWYQY